MQIKIQRKKGNFCWTEKEQIDKKRKNGKTGYTVTNRFSDAMLPEKKRTTRIT